MESSRAPLFIGIKEAAHLLGISRQHLWTLIKDRRGPPRYTHAGKNRTLFRKEELIDWIKQGRR